jgi:hypothetical protein
MAAMLSLTKSSAVVVDSERCKGSAPIRPSQSAISPFRVTWDGTSFNGTVRHSARDRTIRELLEESDPVSYLRFDIIFRPGDLFSYEGDRVLHSM